MENEDIDLTDVPEITNWSGGVRGKFFRNGRATNESRREKTRKVDVGKAPHRERAQEKE